MVRSHIDQDVFMETNDEQQVQCPNPKCGGYRVTTQIIYNGDPSYD